jgi:hypothetical protein
MRQSPTLRLKGVNSRTKRLADGTVNAFASPASLARKGMAMTRDFPSYDDIKRMSAGFNRASSAHVALSKERDPF